MIGSQAEVTYLDYSDVPLINQDIEFPEPEAVSRLRATVKEADGIWVFTPEYNFSYPGHVKNLFDWLSRPLVAGDYETPTVINGKKNDRHVVRKTVHTEILDLMHFLLRHKL